MWFQPHTVGILSLCWMVSVHILLRIYFHILLFLKVPLERFHQVVLKLALMSQNRSLKTVHNCGLHHPFGMTMSRPAIKNMYNPVWYLTNSNLYNILQMCKCLRTHSICLNDTYMMVLSVAVWNLYLCPVQVIQYKSLHTDKRVSRCIINKSHFLNHIFFFNLFFFLLHKFLNYTQILIQRIISGNKILNQDNNKKHTVTNQWICE